MGDQRDLTVLITGANSGLGLSSARAFAQSGARVLLGCRSPERGGAALKQVQAVATGEAPQLIEVDLADLQSVQRTSEQVGESIDRLDVLMNNAGVMAPPERRETVDGFELQFATNYLGHFALTARLLPLLRRAGAARMVTVSSLAATVKSINLADLQSQQAYVPFQTYGMTKLAMLMFALEFQRRSESAGWGIAGLAAHPGFARTDIISNGPASSGLRGALWRRTKSFLLPMSPPVGPAALPILLAATSPHAQGGGYYGPSWILEIMGPPGPARLPRRALDGAAASQLWETSERLAGVSFA